MPSRGPAEIAPRPPPKGRVLLVDDDAQVCRAYRRLLERAGLAVETFADGGAVLERLGRGDIDVLITDIALPGADGLKILRAAHELDPELPVVLMTGGGDLDTATRAVELGALRYLLKPVDPDALRRAVEDALRLRLIAQTRRSAFALYDQAEHETAERAALGTRFDRALGCLRMVYQPIVQWSSRRLAAYEALVRCEEDSLRRPDLLFAAAETIGRLHDLGRAIRASVARTILSTDVPVGVWVNLHPLDLTDDELFSAAAPLSAAARRVTLEITERATLDGMSDLAARLAALRGLGFRIAIDDLGAGYAGLSSFALLEPDAVKLDLSLIRGIDRNTTRQKLVQSMTRLCGELQILVVGEGVETAAERDTLAELDCDLMQGYLFARPGPPFPPLSWEGLAGDRQPVAAAG
jgi:EAL domain-containing protein (putative c-di-GMP-specific phosphodiesterase class I)